MPAWAQWIAHLNPVMYFVRIMRDVLMKGAGPSAIAPEVGILMLYGTVVFTLARASERKAVGLRTPDALRGHPKTIARRLRAMAS